MTKMSEIETGIQCVGFKTKSDNEEIGSTLKAEIEQARIAVNLFFNNEFEKAQKLMEPLAESRMYNALACGVFAFLQAVLTFDPNDIENASKVLKTSIEVCDRFRKKVSITESLARMIRNPDYNTFTDEELHAELCYAECLLVRTVLSFIEDETLVSFIKGGLKMRTCYQSYRQCWNILKFREWTNNPHKVHFEGGVRMGVGSFNLFVSLLPPKILKVLEFVGFNGTKASGLSELLQGYELKDGLRRILNTMILLSYNLLAVYALGTGEGDLVLAESIVNEQIKLYPNGAWFLFFRGRLDQVRGRVEEAALWYQKAWKSQSSWTHFHHICYWELMWSYCLNQDWKQAEEFATKLFNESRWSKCVYAYFRASFLLSQTDLTEKQQGELESLMKDIPSWKQRIAGKSLPMEKFAVARSTKFFAQQKRLQLPALELIYIWNGLPFLGKQWPLIEPCYRQVDRSISQIEKEDYPKEDLALSLLLKGCCLKYMNSPLQAEDCFTQVIQLEKMVPEDSYVVPYGTAELGMLYQSMGRLDEAVTYLEAAKNNFKGYQLESRLHMRVHAALSSIEEARNGTSSSGTRNGTPEADFAELFSDAENTHL